MNATTKPGRLCFGAYDNDGWEWMVRDEGQGVTLRFVLYRAGVVFDRFRRVESAHAVFRSHCPDRGPDLESSLSR